MKIRDIYIQVRLEASKAAKGLAELDKLSKRAATSMQRMGKAAAGATMRQIGSAAVAMGKQVQAATNKAAAGLDKVEKKSGSASSAFASMGRVAASAMSMVVGAVIDATTKSIEFESSMAEISKVVDGLKAPTGETTAEFDKMKESIFALSEEIAVAPKGFADIIAAAGQAGIAREELTGFAEDAAKMSVAFDIGAEDAGEAMAKMRTGLGLSQDEVFKLAGTMNHLSNNMASSASELVGVTRRVGAMGNAAGLTGEQVSAMGSAMISAGAKENVAATGIKNFSLALAAGEAATLRQRTAYAALGLESEDVAKRFAKGGKDTEDTIMDVLKRLKGLDEAKRAATIMQLFGRESMGAIAPLVTQIDNMGKAFDLAADKTAAASSVQNEYDVRSKTTANALQLLSNRVEVTAIRIGDLLLPALNGILEFIDDPEVAAMGDAFVGGLAAAIAEVPRIFEQMKATIWPVIESVIGIGKGFIDGLADDAAKVWEMLGPLMAAFGNLGATVMEALGLAGEEGAAFGEDMGDNLGDVAVKAVDAVTSAVVSMTTVIESLMGVLRPTAAFIKGVLGAAFDVVGEQIDFAKRMVESLANAFEAFSSGNIADGFAHLGMAILDSLLTPIRTVAITLVDLADAIPGGSSAVPAALREFAGKTAMAGVLKMAGKAAEKAGNVKIVEAPMGASRASMQVGVKPKAAPATATGAAGEGAGEGGDEEGGGGGGGSGKKGKKGKKEKKNLLDKAVEDAANKRNVLGGTDRTTAGVGPSVTNIYVTTNIDNIDARGNEGAAGNVERGARRGVDRAVSSLRGVDRARMSAAAGGGTAAGAG